jgi:hypothetical protein
MNYTCIICMTYSTSYCHLTCGSMECNKDVYVCVCMYICIMVRKFIRAYSKLNILPTYGNSTKIHMVVKCGFFPLLAVCNASWWKYTDSMTAYWSTVTLYSCIGYVALNQIGRSWIVSRSRFQRRWLWLVLRCYLDIIWTD